MDIFYARWGHIAKMLCENITFSCEWCITSVCVVNSKQLCGIDLAFLLFAVSVYLSSEDLRISEARDSFSSFRFGEEEHVYKKIGKYSKKQQT